MPSEITFEDKPCRFYWWIGAPCCDACGKSAAEHEGMAIPKPGSSPFGGSKTVYLGLTWTEWREHSDTSKKANAIRHKIAALDDDEVLELADAAVLVAPLVEDTTT